MEDLVEPAPKRRKLSGSPAIPTRSIPSPFSTYITLTRVSLEINISDPALFSSHDGESLEVVLRDVSKEGSGYEVGLATGRAGRRRPAVIEDLSDGHSQILEDAARLDSTAKYKAPAILPLACTYAVVREVSHVRMLEVYILWENTAAVREKVDPILLDILARYLPPTKPVSPIFEQWDPRQFYDNVHVPEKTEELSAELQVPHLDSQLFPFQRRAVRWLLSREKLVEHCDAASQHNTKELEPALPQGFEELKTSSGTRCFANHALGVVSTNRHDISTRFAWKNGGILADEMGLGKTLEIISLICLHPRPPDTVASEGLRESSATLIITPPSILEQWKDELQEHAPTLTVLHYTGIADYKKSGEELIDRLLSHDVVLTTYNVVAKELHYVVEKPERTLRNGRKRAEPPKSPLTQISWWRVCLDEAQMVESGVSAAATVARLVPRTNAWAVTGTPLRRGHRDLFGLLLFLGYTPWCRGPRLWDHLVTYYRSWFQEMLGQIAMRHSKDFVREDLRLPPQSRHTITIPFTPIEEQHYTQLFEEFCEEVKLDRTGGPLVEDWDPESSTTVEKMRTWLTRLRQTCLHPEVGGRNRRALGRNANGPIRTVDEVLDVMIDQGEGQLRTMQRNYLSSMLRRGQLKENAKETAEALTIWTKVRQESKVIVSACMANFSRQRAVVIAQKEKEVEEGDNEDGSHRLHALYGRVRSALEVQHMATFFTANALFQLKSTLEPDSEAYQRLEGKETTIYEAAKGLRVELLKTFVQRVNRLVNTIKDNASDSSEVPRIPVMQEPSEYGGIESRKIFEKLHLYCHAMNVQAEQFHDLRAKMADFLSQALIDSEGDAELQGDEYESSTKQQDSMYAYMEALRALLADRQEAEGEGPAPDVMLKLLNEREEKRVKVKDLGSLRHILAEIRQMSSALQWQESNNQSRATHELAILERVIKHVQQLGATQTKALLVLEQEVSHFRDTMNARLEYYKALQKISDQVAPYREETMGMPLNKFQYEYLLEDEARLHQKIMTSSARHRYLEQLKADEDSAAERMCVICTDPFEIGVMTSCGHTFCKSCITLWYNEHRNCPICKTTFHWNSVHDISYKPAEMTVQAESPSISTSSVHETAHDQSIYSDISSTMLNQIKDVDIGGPSYGSKIDFLCRHLIWLRKHDPGSKSIIFSQYREFIDILSRAFSEAKISCTRIDAKNGTENFKSDPTIECFLLHAKAHSAGLNLVVANHVFLCEPLINAAIELQAIARVHRIGQHRHTNVWMYLVADTVEESIYDISVTRRLAHIRSNSDNSKKKGTSTGVSKSASATTSGAQTPNRDSTLQENAIDAANSMELQAADLSRLLTAGKSGGEIVDKEDLWSCLFGHGRRRVTAGAAADGSAAGSALDGELAHNQPANSAVAAFLRAEAAEARAEGASDVMELD